MKKNLANHWMKTQIVAKDYISSVINHREVQWEFLGEVYLFRMNFVNSHTRHQVSLEWKKFISRQFAQLSRRQPTAKEEEKHPGDQPLKVHRSVNEEEY